MALVDDLLAIAARVDLTEEQKRAERYRIKSVAIRDNLAAVVNTDQTIGNVVIRLTRAPEWDAERKWLTVWGTATVGGVPKRLSLPLVFVNPPVMAPTGAGGSMREDVRGAALRMIRDVVLGA